MRPLLAHIYEPHRVTFPCYVQPKLNGIRALYQNGFFQSRDEVPFTPGLLDHLAKPLLEIFGPEVILDGELYVHGWPLQRINAAVTPVRQEPTEDTKLVEYHVFDVVDFTKSFEARFVNIYHRNLRGKFPPPIFKVKTEQAWSEYNANGYYPEWISLGYEGMMYRLGDCPYTVPKQKHAWPLIGNPGKDGRILKFLSNQDNRVWHLLKRKDWQDAEFECIGTQEGEGKYQGMIGALICKIGYGQCPYCNDQGEVHPYGNRGFICSKCERVCMQPRPTNIFSVSGGLTDLQRQQPPEDFIGKTIKTKYLCLSSDGIPLNPTILAIL